MKVILTCRTVRRHPHHVGLTKRQELFAVQASAGSSAAAAPTAGREQRRADMSSTEAWTCWGKARGAEWMPLPQHLADATAVAGLLWDRWLPDAVRRRIAADLEDAASARALVGFLAAVHDLGKVTPAFASQVPALLPRMHDAGLVVTDDVRGRQRQLRHALSGGIALREWLVDVAGWSTVAAEALAVVVGGHHGCPPSSL